MHGESASGEPTLTYSLRDTFQRFARNRRSAHAEPSKLVCSRREAPGWWLLRLARDAQRPLSHARRLEHGTAHARGLGAGAHGTLAARVLLGRGEGAPARGSSYPTSPPAPYGHD